MESPGRIVHRVEDSAFTSKRDIVYGREGIDLLMDVYTPAAVHPGRPLPAILFVHGGPVPAETQPPKDWPFFQSYGELAAASGFFGVTFNHRFHHPAQFPDSKADVLAAIDYVRAHAVEFGIHAERIGVWIFSGGGPHVSWLLRDRPSYVRCLIAFYAMLDLRHLTPPNADAQTVARINEASAAMYVRDGAKGLPMFIARAGLDAEMVNRGIDVFVEEALSVNAFLDLANHSSGRHGFDFLDDNDRSRSIIAGALAFAKTHLAEMPSVSSLDRPCRGRIID
jgi:acetyl esterase/lipase